MQEYMYRCVDASACFDGEKVKSVGGGFYSVPDFYILRYKVVRETPKGFWIQVYEGKKVNYFSSAPNGLTTWATAKRERFVLADPYKKRFADVTVEKALQSYVERKRVQRDIYTDRAQLAERRMKAAQKQLAAEAQAEAVPA